MRGSDIDFNPVFFGYILVTPVDTFFAVDAAKLPADFQNHFEANNVQINVSPYNEIKTLLQKLVQLTPITPTYVFDLLLSCFYLPDRREHEESLDWLGLKLRPRSTGAREPTPANCKNWIYCKNLHVFNDWI